MGARSQKYRKVNMKYGEWKGRCGGGDEGDGGMYKHDRSPSTIALTLMLRAFLKGVVVKSRICVYPLHFFTTISLYLYKFSIWRTLFLLQK